MRIHAVRTMVIALSLPVLMTAAARAAPDNPVRIESGSGYFLIEGGKGREGRPIKVFYHRPANFTGTSPVLMVIPGAGRNGDDYRDAWIDAAEKYGVLVLSPSYSEKDYPAYWSYNLANMAASVDLAIRVRIDTSPAQWTLDDAAASARTDAGMKRLGHGNPLLHQFALFQLAGMVSGMDAEAAGLTVNRNRAAWIFSDFDRIFETASDALDLNTSRYDMFGHSAGGQILHRTALFYPDSKAGRILAANSGWYTLPRFDHSFPYGLADTGLTEKELQAAFRSGLVVFLGEEDDADETRGSVRHTPEADAQGLHRLARGRYFFRQAEAAAAAMGAEFGWELEVVPGIGHDYRRMSAAAADYLYGNRNHRALQ